MSRNTTVIGTGTDRVFAVLADGWTYGDWMVGVAHVCHVDRHWPHPGSRMRVLTGQWPLLKTRWLEVVRCQARHLLAIRAHWPLGRLHTEFRLLAREGRGTRVVLTEHPERQPLRGTRAVVNDLLLHRRHNESLRRLADIATRRDLSRPTGALPGSPHGTTPL
ncbi:hypothetical protein LX16_0283 [Stackebrandtia albiflava]|uniref:Polyketide cyclase/dehydrase/lipid transport protein n=1 Tax=Stackebrandtia albiflava TaxID=406432 RepID=A0A562V9S4_9ACTN|nr:SRPBCC family protein [Stackebrandtia albiflava]TWJ14598.1 hypothetical protein LX16_0283 [Stackebrandtia albiflava]